MTLVVIHVFAARPEKELVRAQCLNKNQKPSKIINSLTLQLWVFIFYVTSILDYSGKNIFLYRWITYVVSWLGYFFFFLLQAICVKTSKIFSSICFLVSFLKSHEYEITRPCRTCGLGVPKMLTITRVGETEKNVLS